MSRYQINGPLLWESLNTTRVNRGLSWRQVSRETGIPCSTFSRLKTSLGVGANADTFVTALMWLGPGVSHRPFVMDTQESEQYVE